MPDDPAGKARQQCPVQQRSLSDVRITRSELRFQCDGRRAFPDALQRRIYPGQFRERHAHERCQTARPEAHRCVTCCAELLEGIALPARPQHETARLYIANIAAIGGTPA